MKAVLAFAFVVGLVACDPTFDALAAIFKATNGKQWTKNSNWMRVYEYCSWFGITCQGSTIMSIDLSNNNLNGTLPGTLFTIATSINKISFAGNLLSGKIPTEIGALPSLQSLDLSNNGFTGDIPVTFYNSSSLSSITLKNNKLSGKLADFTATPNLYTLDLTNNNIGGDISNLFCSQNSLKTLYLSNNSFTGSLPACVSKMPSLTYLFLDNNQLTSIPEMSKPQGIYYQNYCSLKNNNFECPIPQWTQDYCGAQCSF